MDFYRVEHHTVMSGLVVRYREIAPEHLNSLEISASRDGVSIHGPLLNYIKSDQDLEDVQLVLESAYEQHLHIKAQYNPMPIGTPSSRPFDHDWQAVVELHKAYLGRENEIVRRRAR